MIDTPEAKHEINVETVPLEEPAPSVFEMIKKRVTLHDITPDMWNEVDQDMIWQFIEDPSVHVLIIYKDPLNGIIIEHCIRTAFNAKQLCYFIKTPRTKEVTSENFLNVIQYGSVKGPSFLESLLRMLSGVFAPLFFENTTWPDSIKNDFFAQLHKFLATLTDTHWKLEDKTVLYIPKENLNIPIEIASRHKEFVQRLESNYQLSLTSCCSFIVLSNEIIHQCCKAINLDRIFEGYIKSGSQTLVDCIECCEKWREKYDMTSALHNKFSPKGWVLDLTSIFAQIDAFMQRCKDLLEVCDTQVHFARMEEGKQIEMPHFGGQRGPDITRGILEIEHAHQKYLSQLRSMQKSILDIKSTSWHDDFNRTIDKKTRSTFTVFSEEMNTVKKELTLKSPYILKTHPKYSGSACWLKTLKARIDLNMKVIEKAYFLNQTSFSDITKNYHQLISALDENIRKYFNEWNLNLDKDPLTYLDLPLMQKTIEDDVPVLHLNFNKALLKMLSEIHYWEYLMFEIPYYAARVYSKQKELRDRREHVLLVVRDYNRIINSLNQNERGLFKERIKFLDKKISPGLSKLTWNSKGTTDSFITECRNTAEKIQLKIDCFKADNLKIAMSCVQISEMLLTDIDSRKVYKELEFGAHQEQHRLRTLAKLIDIHQEILSIIDKQFETFKNDGSEVYNYWFIHINNLDRMIEEAFRLNIKYSLQTISKAINIDTKAAPNPLFSVEVILRNDTIHFSPSIEELDNMVYYVGKDMVTSLSQIPRLIEKYPKEGVTKLCISEEISTNDEIKKIKNLIATGMKTNASKLWNYRQTWEEEKVLWEIDKESFITRYKKSQPSVSKFDGDIGRYTEKANNIQSKETVINIDFVVLNCTPLKAAIQGHCIEWQNKLTGLLLELATTELTTLDSYIKTNTKLVCKTPQTLDELKESLKLWEVLNAEQGKIEARFQPLMEQFAILNKYEVPIAEESTIMLHELKDQWNTFKLTLETSDFLLKKSKDQFKSSLMNQSEGFKKQVTHLLEEFQQKGPFSSEIACDVALETLANFRENVNILKFQEQVLRSGLNMFKVDLPPSKEIMLLEKELELIETIWIITRDWETNWNVWKVSKFTEIQTEEIETFSLNVSRKLNKLSRDLKDRHWSVLEASKVKVDTFKRTMPLIQDLKNPAMRPRHWEQISVEIQRHFDYTSEDFTLEKIIELGFDQYADFINGVSSAAKKELFIEQSLVAIKGTWEITDIDMAPFKALYKINFVMSRNIFLGEDIRKQLPRESEDFDDINNKWKAIMIRINKERNALKATLHPGLYDQLNAMNFKLESIQKSLDMYLETKRQIFPRFYFLSNDDLLEILGQARNPEAVQPHLKKCFDNIKSLTINRPSSQRYEAVAMNSSEGECVEFKPQGTVIEGPVEAWLSDIEKTMRYTLKEVLITTRNALKKQLNKRDKWIRDYCGQMTIVASQIQWTGDVTKALLKVKERGDKKALKMLKKKQVVMLNKYAELARKPDKGYQRMKLVSLITIEVHSRDIIEKLLKTGCNDANAFEWISQLRLYWDKELNDCIVRQTNTQFLYGYEYLGNSGRLVITPLTDRCYMTLTTALHLHRGGSPKGPAGTGKTETTKDLGKALGNYVIVVNCSEGLDYKSMGRMFSGLAQTGAWGCFDEFNRINIEVLSVVAQQILSILTALHSGAMQFLFEGREINLVWSCGIFITMNPGYAGRTELPDNLKSMFRPIAMVVPDSNMIAEIILFGEGFSNTKILLLSLKDMNIAKLTSVDLPLFNGIMSDLFPGVEPPIMEDDKFKANIKSELIESNLLPNAHTIVKVIQLGETKDSRHSTMIVGKTQSGKTVTWKILQAAKNRDSPQLQVKEYPLNPKALSLGELYGEFDLSSNEWSDGVLSSIMRQTCSDEKKDEKWIIFDGPVDTLWIESMNSVMDDNKVLTLINGERIGMPEQVSLLFEVEDLAMASPATVSRCGMVYTDYNDLGWEPYVECWINGKKNKELVEEIRRLIAKYLVKMLTFKRDNCKELVPTAELNGVVSLCKLFDCFATAENGVDFGNDPDNFSKIVELWFQFCMIWSICCSVDEDGRKKIDTYIREMEGTFPTKDSIYEYFVDSKNKSWVHWEEKLKKGWRYNPSVPFYKLVVPTVDTVRYQYLVSHLIYSMIPVLLVGPVGTGKTSVAGNTITLLDTKIYNVLTVYMSAQTTSNNIQDIIESRVEKRTKGVYVPVGGKKLITFLDDFNMPAKDLYGSQPPLELIRLWLDYAFWYDRNKQTPKHIKGMLLVAAMGPPGGGRMVISKRLQSRFNLINMTFPTDSEVIRIFGSMINQKLQDFEEEVKPIGDVVTRATVEIYTAVVNKFLPTPTKIHYLFNLRDISRVFQGMLRAHKDYHDTKVAITRLWIHECFRSALIGCSSGDYLNADLVYEDIQDMSSLKKQVQELLFEYNHTPGVVPMDLVLFRDAIEHVSKIVRVIRQPRGNMLLVGIGGSGRQSLTRLASSICEYTLFAIEVTKHYRKSEFREDPTIHLHCPHPHAQGFCGTGHTTNNIRSEVCLGNVKNALSDLAKKEGLEDTPQSIFAFLIDRVRTNLHVVMCMSPVGEPFRNRIRMYPAFVNCTTIDWFSHWPQDALLEVADKYLVDMKTSNEEEEKLKHNIAKMFSQIHKSVFDYSARMTAELKRHNYVTPTNYLELVSGYKLLLLEKKKELGDAANKLKNGLSKIDETREKVQKMSVELDEDKIKVAQVQQQCDEYLSVLFQQKKEADDQQKFVAQKSERISEEEIKCKHMADLAQQDLSEAMPALEEAMLALEALNKKDIGEIKSYGRPPALVEKVMEAVMILKGSEPNWAEAKRQLGDPNFIKSLVNFDKDNISDRVLNKIGKYVSQADFTPDIIGRVSGAAKSLCMWVRAMEMYGRIYRVVEANMLALRNQYDERIAQKEELRLKAERTEMMLDRAHKLVSGLAGEKVRWEETVTTLEESMGFLIGDCLIGAAFLSYMGPFLSNYRDELVYKIWLKALRSLGIPCDPCFSFCTFLVRPTLVRQWNIQGLPSDAFSTENGIIVTKGNRWPLMIDPQGQAIKWIKRMEGKNGLKIIDLQQSDFMRNLEKAIQYGLPVLLQNVQETLDPSLDPILFKSVVKIGNVPMIKLGDKEIEYNRNFRFYITTKLSNPHYTPEISTKTTIVNFAVKEQGLVAQLLGIVVRKERPELEEQKDSLVQSIAANKKKLEECEDEILRLLNETKGSLLEDETLVNTLQTSKSTSQEVTEQLATSEQTEAKIDSAREGYSPCAERASILFFVLNDLGLIDPMYQFSLDSYIDLFILSIEKSHRSTKLEERIQNLNDYHTFAMYRYACRGLFGKHKLLFSFQTCVKILEAASKINMDEYNFFLRGGVVIDRENQMDNPCSGWLSDAAWDNITELDKLTNFHGMITSFEQYPRDWHLWYISSEPEQASLPSDWDNACNELQRMLIVRSLRPDRVAFCSTTFIINNLGSKFVEPPVLDMNQVLSESSKRTPLIFVLSPGVDPANYLIQLAETKGMGSRFHALSLGQGQAPIATRMLQEGVREGNWVFLANCHLSLSWMPQLDKLIEQLQTDVVTHSEFRLWLSSSPHPEFPISILQAGIKMTTEPPKGLKANMKRLYNQLEKKKSDYCTKQEKYKKLLFALCYFHSVLLERRKFLMLGWNIPYEFNDSDFEVSENLLSIYLQDYEETPWDALKYLIAGINYGGHVTDDYDRRLLFTYINDYFCDQALTQPFFKSQVLDLAANIYQQIPEDIDYETTRVILSVDMSPLAVVLLQEIQRYNELLEQMRSSLKALEKGIQGLVVMTFELEMIFNCIFDGRVPPSWEKAYPSLKPLSAWTRDLVFRIEQLNKWAQTAHPPTIFWLSGFTFPTGFLTAVLQTSARQNNISVDLLSWDFTVMTVGDSNITGPPKDGVYVKGLYLQGAGWDQRNACLVEALPIQLVCPMPSIHFKPVENKKKSLKGEYLYFYSLNSLMYIPH
eukprot:XP_014781690.1 PREDICTED: dynein heavy chain 2, axonemal-like [Octopus bimaculoides]